MSTLAQREPPASVILRCLMADEPMTPDLVPLLKRLADAVGRRDVDAITGLYAPDGVWDLSP